MVAATLSALAGRCAGAVPAMVCKAFAMRLSSARAAGCSDAGPDDSIFSVPRVM